MSMGNQVIFNVVMAILSLLTTLAAAAAAWGSWNLENTAYRRDQTNKIAVWLVKNKNGSMGH